MSWIAAGMIGSQVVGGVMSSRAQKKQAAAQQQGYEQAGAQTVGALNKYQDMVKPYTSAGAGVMNPMMREIRGTNPFQDMAAESYAAQVGEQLRQGQAASGRFSAGETPGLIAGGMAKVMMDARQQRIANMMGVAGMGQNSAMNLGAAGMDAAANSGNALLGAADARGQRQAANSQAFANTLGGVANTFAANQMGLFDAPTNNAAISSGASGSTAAGYAPGIMSAWSANQ